MKKAKGCPLFDIVKVSRKLSKEVSSLNFAPPTCHVYNPLDYAWESHEKYLKKYGTGGKQVLLLGMNPGPFGMAQTGVPFGDISMVKEWLGISAKVKRPQNEHPKRPIEGFDCPRSEVSGTRLWGWAKDNFSSAEEFAERFFVWNYCPLCFLEESGKNRTPDKLGVSEREALFLACDDALRSIIEGISPEFAIGIGVFAEKRIGHILKDSSLKPAPKIGRILHPSPASPMANRGWEAQAKNQLVEMGIQAEGRG